MAQLGGLPERILGPLLKVGLPLIKNVLKPLVKNILVKWTLDIYIINIYKNVVCQFISLSLKIMSQCLKLNFKHSHYRCYVKIIVKIIDIT